MKQQKQPLKGQRSIASFVFKKVGNSDKKLPTSSSAERAPAPSEVLRPHDDHNASIKQLAPEGNPPAAKRARSAAPSVAKEHLHQRWRSKLVGGETAGIGKVRTQDGVMTQGSQKMTPLELQVAALHEAHPGCVLAIECGYKYRFFGRDAEIASQVLGIFAYPDRNYLTAGVPTVNIERHVRRLVLAGHKVGIVRQTESAAIKAAGDNKSGPFERKLTAVYTRATLEAGELAAGKPALKKESSDDLMEDDPDQHNNNPIVLSGGISEQMAYSNELRSSYIVCIVEGSVSGMSGTASQLGNIDIGIIAVETSTGDVLFSQLKDSPMRLELESRLMFAAPSELLLVTPLSGATRRLLEAYGSESAGVRKECADGSIYEHGGALSALVDFYGDKNGGSKRVEAVMSLPPLVVRALAHCLDHLRAFKLEAVMRLGNASFREFSEVQELTLSPNALLQLEILRNADDGKERGSLLWLMDRTLTTPGARMVRRWVSRPLRSVLAIEQRLEAVEEMICKGGQHPTLVALPPLLKSLSIDLERVLGRALHQTSSPPEFLDFLRRFAELPGKLDLHVELDRLEAAPSGPVAIPGLTSTLLRKLFTAAADLKCAKVAREYLALIDPDAAASGDLLKLFVPSERFAEVTSRRHDVDAALTALDDLRPGLAKVLNVRVVQYVHVANQGDFLVEVPAELEKRAPKEWQKISTTKKVARFRPPEVKKALSSLELAREHLAITAKVAWKRLLLEFSEHYAQFRAATDALAALDCLNGFASLASSGGSQPYVRPQFIADDEAPQLHIVGGRHPVLDVLLEGSFVPNDTHLGGGGDSVERCYIVTGPNMGGKSCYIRQAALVACMAQIGSFVPATSCRMHAFDAVYTRMGAADNIALGRSTFLEELSEASAILQKATPRSLVIIDELGRGTTTKDGRAIAAATLEYLVNTVQCLSLFVTHFPEVARLPEQLKNSKLSMQVGAYYMAHVVEDEGGDGRDDGTQKGIPQVTFLYKVTKGVAEASYGLNVARMAGLPLSVVYRAREKANEALTEGEKEKTREFEEERLADQVATQLKTAVQQHDGLIKAAIQGLQMRVKYALK